MKENGMKKAVIWLLALLITLFTAFYQRVTGPTYPIRGKVRLNGTQIKYKLERSQESGQDYKLRLSIPNSEISGFIIYKRYKTDDPWTKIPLTRESDFLFGLLPSQPPAGKLEYKVFLTTSSEEISLTGEKPAIMRFKGHVPAGILIPHILIMFTAMFVSTRAGLEALRPNKNPRKYALWTFTLLFVGGMVFGSLVQKLAFGSFWTGFPFGYDLTDNKTLIALVGWLLAVIAGRRGKPARGWVLGASILLIIVFLIPHSLLGSELKY